MQVVIGENIGQKRLILLKYRAIFNNIGQMYQNKIKKYLEKPKSYTFLFTFIWPPFVVGYMDY